jgi:hypothetical protein
MTLPEPVEMRVVRWRCSHCPRSWSRKSRTVEHIAQCWFNPANRSCKTCVHRIEPDSEYGYDTDEGCYAGVELERDPVTPQLAILPLHCPKWEAS